jgi:hypothetical protein
MVTPNASLLALTPRPAADQLFAIADDHWLLEFNSDRRMAFDLHRLSLSAEQNPTKTERSISASNRPASICKVVS